MFEKTRVQLAIQNSFILILVISAIAVAVYSYMQVLLYSDLDKDLENLMEEYVTLVENGIFPVEGTVAKPTFIQDPRVQIIYWDENGDIIELDEEEAIFRRNQAAFRPNHSMRIEEKAAGGYYFRTISTDFETDYGTVQAQLLRNVNSEKEMLKRVGMILALGTFIGGCMSIVAGFYLAGVALVPIRGALRKQQQFVSDASHELRTPLAVIQSRADLLLRSPQSTIEDKAEEISVISKECRRLTKLVGNLLMLARTDSNAININNQRFDLSALLTEIVELYGSVAEMEGKKVVLKAESGVMLNGDKERIHQMIVILLDNALKFTNEHGEVTVFCKKVNNQVELSVADNGIGIRKEDLPHIFDRFYQGEKSRSDEEGTGLGLSIAKWVIEQHQAKVKVNSEVGKGTNVKITFPKT